MSGYTDEDYFLPSVGPVFIDLYKDSNNLRVQQCQNSNDKDAFMQFEVLNVNQKASDETESFVSELKATHNLSLSFNLNLTCTCF